MSKVHAINSFFVKPAFVTESDTLSVNHSGKTFFMNVAGGCTVTLPNPLAGVRYEFIVKTAPTSGDYIFDATSAIIKGQAYTADLNNPANPDFDVNGEQYLRFKSGVAKVGDSIEIYSDGTYWYYKGFSSVGDAILLQVDSKSPSVSPSVSVSISPSVSPSASPS